MARIGEHLGGGWEMGDGRWDEMGWTGTGVADAMALEGGCSAVVKPVEGPSSRCGLPEDCREYLPEGSL